MEISARPGDAPSGPTGAVCGPDHKWKRAENSDGGDANEDDNDAGGIQGTQHEPAVGCGRAGLTVVACKSTTYVRVAGGGPIAGPLVH